VPAPELLPIKRQEDLHTDLIGQCDKGQFMIVETLPVPGPRETSDIPARRYIVQYLFRSSGELVRAKHIAISNDAPDESIGVEKERLLQECAPYTFGDIMVKPFAVEIDGMTFGLVYSEEMDAVNLEPRSLITFMAPWDGEYYT
jgi:hypothetical protein